MNERIRELCSQAISDVDGIQNPDTQNMYIPDCFAEKFAELIVRECGNVAWQHTPETEELEYSHLIKDKILKRFGVEE
jgi:hypothetical protein